MKTKVFIHALWGEYSKKFEFTVHSYKLSGSFFFIEEQTIEFKAPDEFTLRQHTVNHLREEKQKLLADAQIEANTIDEKIQELLALSDSRTPQEKKDDDIPF